MSDLQTEVEFLTEELHETRKALADAYSEKAALADICRGYHQILFGIPLKENLDKVMSAIALGFAASWEGEKPPARNFVTQDVTIACPKPKVFNVTVQRVEGKSPSEVLGELQEAVGVLIATVALYNPPLAQKAARCLPEEIPDLLKQAALADRS